MKRLQVSGCLLGETISPVVNTEKIGQKISNSCSLDIGQQALWEFNS
jgi:hypothetical protein